MENKVRGRDAKLFTLKFAGTKDRSPLNAGLAFGESPEQIRHYLSEQFLLGKATGKYSQSYPHVDGKVVEVDERTKNNYVPRVDIDGYLESPEPISIYYFVRGIQRWQIPALFSNLCNIMGKFDSVPAGKQVGEEMRMEHRTIQAAFINVLLGMLVGISDQSYTDPRNEVAIQTAKKIAEMIENGELGINAFI